MNKWTTHLDTYEEILDHLARLAEHNGFVINPDTERVEKVVGLMTENLLLAGKHFCPCKQTHPIDPAVDVVCPCPAWKDEIAKEGHCFCRLFFQAGHQAET